MWFLFDWLKKFPAAFSDFFFEENMNGQTKINTEVIPYSVSEYKNGITTVKPKTKYKLTVSNNILKWMLDDTREWFQKDFQHSPYFVWYEIGHYITILRHSWFIKSNGYVWRFMTYKITPEWRDYIQNILALNNL